jgi:hypothetical protein
MRLSRAWILSITFIAMTLAGPAAATTSQICVAPWQRESSDTPLDRRVQSNSVFTFSGRGIPKLRSPVGKQGLLADAPSQFRVSVALDGKPMESFKIDTRSYPGGKACMWLYFPHVTWQVGPYLHGKNGCRCFGNP